MKTGSKKKSNLPESPTENPPGKSCKAGFPPRHLPAGFTLLEVLISLAVLSVMLIALHQAYASNIFITSYTRGLWKAMVFTHNELLKIERGPSPSISFNEGDYDEDHAMAGYHWKRRVEDETPLPGIKVRKITLGLTWKEGNSDRIYQAMTYVLPK